MIIKKGFYATSLGLQAAVLNMGVTAPRCSLLDLIISLALHKPHLLFACQSLGLRQPYGVLSKSISGWRGKMTLDQRSMDRYAGGGDDQPSQPVQNRVGPCGFIEGRKRSLSNVERLACKASKRCCSTSDTQQP